MRVHIGGDHAAFDLKAELVRHLLEQGHDVVDHGPDSFDPEDDYPVAVRRAAMGVRSDEGSLGVVLGGSGNGEQIAANKVEGIRCALAWTVETARLAHLWYHKHHVLGEPDEIMNARLALARATQVVLRNALGILGISAPERM